MRQIYSYEQSLVVIDDGIVVSDNTDLLKGISFKSTIREIICDPWTYENQLTITIIYDDFTAIQYHNGEKFAEFKNVNQILPTVEGFLILFNDGKLISSSPSLEIHREAQENIKFIATCSGRYITLFSAVRLDNTVIYWGWDNEPPTYHPQPIDMVINYEKSINKILIDEYYVIILYEDRTLKYLMGLLCCCSLQPSTQIDIYPTNLNYEQKELPQIQDIIPNDYISEITILLDNGDLFKYEREKQFTFRNNLLFRNVKAISENYILTYDDTVIDYTTKTTIDIEINPHTLLIKSASKH